MGIELGITEYTDICMFKQLNYLLSVALVGVGGP